MALEMDLQHQDLAREYEARAAYHVATRDELRLQIENNHAFARYVLLRTGALKGATELQRLDRRHGGHAARVQKAYRGAVRTARKPVDFAAGPPELRYGTSLNLLEQIGRVWVVSARSLGGSIEYRGERPWLPPILRRDLEVFARNDRWIFELWRPVPLLRETEARATYGSTSETFGFSIAQSLSPRLRAAYELTVSPAERRPTESVFKVQYGTRI
jgi:hypothetical protein